MRSLCVFCIILCSLFASAQTNKQILTASVLWEVKAPKTNKVSYILGSMHTVKADSFVYKFTKILDLLANCRVYACESLGLRDSVEAKKYTDAFNEKPKKSFKKWFGKDSAMVDNFFVKHFNYKERPSQIINIDCSNLIMQVSALGHMQSQIYDSINIRSGLHKGASPIFDEMVNNTMMGLKKPILQLDDATFMSQKVLSDNFYTSNVLGYMKTFERLNQNDEAGLKKDGYYNAVKAMKQYYSSANFDYILKDKAIDVHVDRNRTWLKKLLPELEKGNVFILVGLGHLFGDSSCLIPALKRNGFIVSPINLTPETP